MWCCGVRFALVVPRTLLAENRSTAARLLLLPQANLPIRRPGASGLFAFACSSRWIRPCFSQDDGSILDRIDLVPACPSSPPLGRCPRVQRPCARRPNATTAAGWRPSLSDPVGALILCPGTLKSGQTRPSSAALAGRRSDQFRSPCGSDRRDPNSLAPNRSKLGRLRYARQGLVRVPESNTKYGGQDGITGGSRAPVIGPSISESSGNPNRKNCPPACGLALRPLFTAEDFFPPPPLPLRDSRNRTGVAKRHVGTEMAQVPDRDGMRRADSPA